MTMNVSIARCFTWATMIGAALAMVLMLSGCNGSGPASYYLSSSSVTLPDGRHVVCVVNGGQHGGTGVSCDWGHVR